MQFPSLQVGRAWCLNCILAWVPVTNDYIHFVFSARTFVRGLIYCPIKAGKGSYSAAIPPFLLPNLSGLNEVKNCIQNLFLFLNILN